MSTIQNFVSSCMTNHFLWIQDHNGDGQLSLPEFTELIDVFGNNIAAAKV